MSKYIVKIKKLTLPVIPVRGLVAFPGATINFELTEDIAIKAAEAAFDTDSPILVCTYRSPDCENPLPDGLFRTGTVCKIKQSVRSPEGGMRILAEGYSRAAVTEFRLFADYILAEVNSKTHTASDEDAIRNQAYCRAIISEAKKLASFLPSVSDDMLTTASGIKTPALLADFIAANMLVKFTDKQLILECFDPEKRIELLIALLEEESGLLACEMDIHKRVRSNLNQNQKEYYLREQIRVIKNELGDTDEADEYFDRIMAAKLPDEVREKLLKENERMSKAPFGSSESTVARSYLDTCLEIPWSVSTKDRVNIASAKKILDSDHDGLDKVKERILEYLAVKQLNPQLGNQILCLVGPPGVGKTSVGASIAKAMNRKYVRVSLGGVRDEADIRGHRKTYIGAMPGRIINALIQAKVNNPLILLDEIDKLTRDSHGDPASALLEVLDGEQNKTFRDHFVELPFDLSGCLFIATANTLDTVPRPLLDRMEVIELKSYTKNEKISIAHNHLIPKQLKRHGLNKRMVAITDDAIAEIADFYTREAGVRNLERAIADICRKAAKKLVEEEQSGKIKVTAANVEDYLGPRKRLPDSISDEDEVGTVNGLAWTAAGGDMLRVEVAVLDGTGKIELTGSLGDVMKESARIAVSYVRSIAADYGIPTDFYQKKDIHIHFPEGAVPKDGPSAGVTMVTALVSALTGRAVRRDIAMTGEVSLRGNVLAIGGLKEKTMAAYSAGVKEVLIPADNERNLDEVDTVVRKNLRFVPCKKATDVLAHALCPVVNTVTTGAKKTDAEERTEIEIIAPAKIPADKAKIPVAR
ncbi:MAG: endopeptidase La [Clostridia bacterium]|nr:endopeptidase La [Clostridia bacterium]